MTIQIMPGTYTGTGDNIITLPAHGITLLGIGGAGSTTIDGQGQRRGLLGDGCGDNGTVIEGLTFTNGLGRSRVWRRHFTAQNCSPNFHRLRCQITNNQAGGEGSNSWGRAIGIYLYGNNCNPTFTDCLISWKQRRPWWRRRHR